MDAAAPPLINNLEVQCLVKIFGHLSKEECATLSCVQKFWRTVLQDDMIWRKFCKDTFGLESPVSPSGDILPSFRFHDGQELEYDAWIDGNQTLSLHPSVFHGMFGGYCFYQNVACTRMLSLQRMVHWTQELRTEGYVPATGLVVAATQDFRKMFVVNIEDASIEVHTSHPIPGPAATPADPTPGSHDGVLRWMEEWGQRLHRGVYGVSRFEPENPYTRGINLFPVQPPELVVEVTQGVKVSASAIMVPEHCRVNAPDAAFLFAYSIRFQLLGGEEQAAAWPPSRGPPTVMQTCQLMGRHWVIRGKNDEIESEVRGEAVVGKYPLLRAGGPEFVYQSCTSLTHGEGSMAGDFKFVQGSIRQPSGPEFDVICPRFMLKVPDFLY